VREPSPGAPSACTPAAVGLSDANEPRSKALCSLSVRSGLWYSPVKMGGELDSLLRTRSASPRRKPPVCRLCKPHATLAGLNDAGDAGRAASSDAQQQAAAGVGTLDRMMRLVVREAAP